MNTQSSDTNTNKQEDISTSVTPRRRMKDNVDTKNTKRKLNLDRRRENHERRVLDNSDYTGPARRLTIDRRLKVTDRREAEGN